MALSAPLIRKGVAAIPAAIVPEEARLRVAASQTLYQGALIVNDLGYAKAASGTLQGHLRCVGVVQGGVPVGGTQITTDNADNSSGAAGAILVEYKAGVFLFDNDSGVNALTAADEGQPCYAKDDNTVSLDSAQYNRPQAGIFLGLDANSKCKVAVGGPAFVCNVMSFDAHIDLSSLQYTAIKLTASSGVARADTSTAGSEETIGILLNAPDAAGDPAIVCVGGPCPVKATSNGFTAAVQLTAHAGGLLEVAAAEESYVGHALETAGASETKMALIAPGRLGA